MIKQSLIALILIGNIQDSNAADEFQDDFLELKKALLANTKEEAQEMTQESNEIKSLSELTPHEVFILGELANFHENEDTNSPKAHQNKINPLEEEMCHDEQAYTSEICFKLGRKYYDEAKYIEALKYWNIAASMSNNNIDTNIALSENNIGVLYEYGLGTNTNLKLAKIWYEKASSHGNDKAIKSLERINGKLEREEICCIS